jgi:hypothetical protein
MADANQLSNRQNRRLSGKTLSSEKRGIVMKPIASLLVIAAAGMALSLAHATGQSGEAASPIYGVSIPPGYRNWRLISLTHEEGNYNQLRATLGNDVAISAYREGKLPFPDGAVIVALHWNRVPSDEDNKVFGRVQAFVAGSLVNMQVMVKDSTKYAATGGWGFADFRDGKPSNEAVHKTCFSCHTPAKDRDFVFTRYAP